MTGSLGSVSVVVPAYNAAATLPGAVASVTGDPLVRELLVVDDGSTDATAEVAAALPGVTLLRRANGGPSAARNTGIEAAAGEWVAFLDADDRWLPGKLDAQLRAASEHPEAVLVATDWVREGEPVGPGQTRWPLPVEVHGYEDLLVMNRFQTSTVLARTAVLRELGGFLPELDGAEDWDMWLRCAAQGPIVRIAAPLVVYRDEASGYSKDLHRLYRTMLVMLDREQARGRLPRRQLATIRAWHHLRFAVAFGIQRDWGSAASVVTDLPAAGVAGRAPAAATRYLTPFLLSRLRRRTRAARSQSPAAAATTT